MAEGDLLISLISSEGDKIEFSAEILRISDWLQALPNPYEPVQLNELEIDTDSLRHILNVLNCCQYKFPEISDRLSFTETEEQFGNVSETINGFLKSLSTEELLRVLLASYQLEIRMLTKLLCLHAASLLKNLTPDNIAEKMVNNVADFEDLDKWVAIEFPWVKDVPRTLCMWEFES